MKLVELQQILRAADPAAVLVAPHILDRIIQQAFALPRVIWTVPHRKSFIVDRQVLFQHVDQAELPVAPDQLIPPTVILLAYPSLDDLNDEQEPLLLKYWRRLFHASVHKLMEDRWNDRRLTSEGIRERIAVIGRTEFEEIRTVLTQDNYLPTTADERTVYVEFVAMFLELELFFPNLLRVYFPGIRDLRQVSQLLAQDVDGAELFRKTRLADAPNPVVRTASNSEEAHEYYWKLIQSAASAAGAGNTVRAAILRRKAARVAPGGKGASTQVESVAELDKLTRRLQAALQLTDAEAAEWQKDLPKLLDKADQGSNPVEAVLLFDLQKICFDHEQDVYALDLMEWLISGFRRPIKRPLPSLRVVRITRHLRSAVQLLTMARLSDDDRQHLARLLETALAQSEDRLRSRFRPILRDSLMDAGLRANNAPEQTAFDKMVEEMLDHISAYGYLTFSDLRDVISRNQLKLPDLQDPQDFIHGDQLMRLDRRLFTLLDGVYKPSELYLRWLERFGALNFGTAAGRWLTRYVSVPFGLAFLILFAGKLVIDKVQDWVDYLNSPKVTVFKEGPFEKSKALDARAKPGKLEDRAYFSRPPLTVEFWAKLYGKSSRNALVANDTSNPFHWEFFTNQDGLPAVTIQGAEKVELLGNSPICADGDWHHLALTYVGSIAKLWVDGEFSPGKAVKPRLGSMSDHAVVLIGASPPDDLHSHCDGLIAELRLSSAVRTFEKPQTEQFKIDDEHTIALCHLDSAVCSWQTSSLEQVLFLKSWFFWLLSLAAGGLILALFQSEPLRRCLARAARLCWQPVLFLFVDLPHWVVDMPLIKRIGESWSFQLAYWYLLLPTLVAVPFFCVLQRLLVTDHALGVSAALAFMLAFILVNSRFGQATQALFKQSAIWLYELFRSGFIPGLVHLVAWAFKEIRALVETVIYTVDEWLRFRKGETRLSMVLRTFLGALWFPFSYLLRFYFIVLVEPCINPPKLAMSIIAAKIVYPLLGILGVIGWVADPWPGGWVVAWAFVALTLYLLPDAFAFLLWEMREDYRLYRANRSPNLKPVMIGAHGETVRGLLQPGFHSGTIPRLYAKLRWAERRAFLSGSWRSVRFCLQSLHEVELAVRRFVERDFVHLLSQGPGWKDGGVRVGGVSLASNRISVELLHARFDRPVLVEFEFWSGWLVAGIREPGWLTQLTPEQQQTLVMALAGFYKLTGIDLVREQVRKILPEDIEHYDLTREGLVLWRGHDRRLGMAYNLRDHDDQLLTRASAGPAEAPVLEVQRLLYSRLPLTWQRWVHGWEKNSEKNGQVLFDNPVEFFPALTLAAPLTRCGDGNGVLPPPAARETAVVPPANGQGSTSNGNDSCC